MQPEMTMRDHFAAAALTGLIASREWPIDSDEAAHYCYRVADAMLRERGNQPEPPDSSMPDADSRVWETQGHQRPTLTDAEREAVDRAADWLDRWQQTHGYHSSESGDLATLRGLLERTK